MSELKKGITLSYVLIVVNNIVKLTYTPFLIRALGTSEYGLYSIAAATVGYMAVMDLGFGNAIIRYTAKYNALKNYEKVNKLHGMFLSIYFVIGFIVGSFGFLLYYNCDLLFENTMSHEEVKTMKTLVMLLSFNLAITFPFSIFGSIIIANEKFIFSKLLSIILVLLNPLIMIPFLLLGYKSIALVLVLTVINILMLVTNCIYCYKKIKIRPCYFYFDKILFKEIFVYSIYIFINAIVDQLYWNSGQFILGSVSGTTEVAIYSVALTFKGLYFAISSAIVSILLPKVTHMVVKNNSTQQLSELFVRVGRLQFLVLSLILSMFVLFGQRFVILWAGSEYSSAFYIALSILIPVTIPLMQNVGITILQAQNKQQFRSLVYVALAITGTLLSIYLSKIYGGLGCAIAIGSCLLIGNGITLNIYYHKKIGLNIVVFWKEIFKSFLPIFLTGLGFYILREKIYGNDEVFLITYLSHVFLYFAVFSIVVWLFVMNNYEKSLINRFLQKFKK